MVIDTNTFASHRISILWWAVTAKNRSSLKEDFFPRVPWSFRATGAMTFFPRRWFFVVGELHGCRTQRWLAGDLSLNTETAKSSVIIRFYRSVIIEPEPPFPWHSFRFARSWSCGKINSPFSILSLRFLCDFDDALYPRGIPSHGEPLFPFFIVTKVSLLVLDSCWDLFQFIY